MALTATTLNGAITADATLIRLTSGTGAGKGKYIKVDDEFLLQTADADSNATTLIPVKRGQNGTQAKAHPTSAVALIGTASNINASPDFGGNQVDTQSSYPLAGRQRRVSSYSAAGAIALPSPGTDEVAVLNGTGTEAYSIAAPTKDMDGCLLFVVAGGAGAKVITVTGGMSGAGTSYDAITLNATAVAGFMLIACNGLWLAPFQPAMGGTVTNLIGSVA